MQAHRAATIPYPTAKCQSRHTPCCVHERSTLITYLNNHQHCRVCCCLDTVQKCDRASTPWRMYNHLLQFPTHVVHLHSRVAGGSKLDVHVPVTRPSREHGNAAF